MDTTATVPLIDPVGLPAPAWLFEILLLVTFTLHLLAMNGMLGCGIIAVASLLGSGGRRPERLRLAAALARAIPSLVAATITLGVAALLFVQVLFGQALYTSSVIVAWPWLLLLVVLILSYYGFYASAGRAKHLGAEGQSSSALLRTLLPSVLGVLVVGFILVNNMTLALRPPTWMEKHLTDRSGWNLNLAEPTLWARYLHFMVGAVAVGGLWVVVFGLLRWRRDEPAGRHLVLSGGRWFMMATMVQFATGMWFLMAMPREEMRLFMSQDIWLTALFGIGFVASAAAIVLAAVARRRPDPRPLTVAAMIVGLVVLIIMVLMRHGLRRRLLEPWIRPAEMPLAVQWGPMVLFLLLFVAGVGLWIVMLRRYAAAASATDPVHDPS